ncbi:MAG: HTTM domain-containing protein [Myxococcota bacterium]
MTHPNPAHRAWSWLNRPFDVASLAVFRILFGVLMMGAVVRYVQMGWIERFYLQHDFHFSYWGFDWLQPPPGWGVYALFAVVFVLAFCIAVGLFYRFAIVAFFLVFTYVELIDVTNYLNHYYQVSLLALLMSFLPLHRAWSVDAMRRPALRRSSLPAWMTYLLRFQVGVVYFYAGLAKAGPDWLLHGQPLGMWLAARTDTPVIGALLDFPWVAVAMSWAGFLHDLLIVPALLWRRSRPFAYAVLVVFHAATGYFFNIGIFPFLMTTTALVFFSPGWPRKVWSWGRRMGLGSEGSILPEGAPSDAPRDLADARSRGSLRSPDGVRGFGVVAVAAYCVVQLLVPLRAHAYGGDVLWHEQGMRWSWRVMVREKQGSVTYHVRLPDGRETQISPCKYLTQRQEREMAGQPDLVLQLAHHIADDFRARGHGDVEVRAEALVSLNGRPPAPMVDPSVDLARVPDGLAKAGWILPAPEGPPPRLHKPSGRPGRRVVAEAHEVDE